MKALSIIGIVLSLLGILWSATITEIKVGCDNSSESDESFIAGLVALGLFVFFLAFSITATVVSFRSKRNITKLNETV